MRYLFDTHVHTSESSPCGKVCANDVIANYINSEYHGIVITDHFSKIVMDSYGVDTWKEKVDRYLLGYRTAKTAAQKNALTVILGMELRFCDHPNDYLVYGITEEFLYSHPDLFSMTLLQFYELANQNDLIVYQAHPFRRGITPASPEFLDGMEVYNAHPRHDSKNDKALAYAVKYGLRQLSGSDAHQPPDFARGGVYFSTSPKDSIEFMQLLRNNDVLELRRAQD